jgi:K+-transporting ATPase ATPase C chain
MKGVIQALLVFVTLSLLLGLAYPFAMTGISQLLFPHKANGSLVALDNRVVGSSLIGQNFTDPKYFKSRPSVLEKPYDAGNSGGSNFGPSSAKLLEEVEKRIQAVRVENGLDPAKPVPADLAFASASGLDPHISVEAATVQVPRVAKTRGLRDSSVQALIEQHAEASTLGLFGNARVNVLRLNLSLDKLGRR